jgi:tetratricopeptide (TPR) repeat protein
LSHSKANWTVVKDLIEALKSSNVWVDQFDLDVGDPLPAKIERGIQDASAFILVLSRASLESTWVQFESHMAVIRHLEDQNFRLLIVKVDDCEVPLRFKPFLYTDLTKDGRGLSKLVDFVAHLGQKDAKARRVRRHFVNRAKEIGEIEQFTNDETKSIICITGFFGMGKRSLAEEAIRRIWQDSSLVVISLSEAHIGGRLCAALCNAAGLPVLPDNSAVDELKRQSILAVETLVEKDVHLVFDHLDSLLDDQGDIHADFRAVLQHLAGLKQCSEFPIFVLSKRMPRLDMTMKLRTGYLKLSGLSDSHMVSILESEAMRLSQKNDFDKPALEQIAKHLHGYPLAGRLAAPLFAKFEPAYVLDNFIYITGLRRDVAEAILSGLALGDTELELLRLLAMTSPVAMSVRDIQAITGKTPENIVETLDQIADHNLIETSGSAVYLHPLVSDFYWKQARAVSDFESIANSIADRAKARLQTMAATETDYAQWLALACRMLYLANKASEAFALRRDFVGELKVAAIELYQRQEYERALHYCEDFLKSDPDDFEIAYHRARALSRVGRTGESLEALNKLLEKQQTSYRRARLHFGKGRAFLEARDFNQAKDEFLTALADNPKLLPALQGIIEVLMKTDAEEEAWPFIEQALAISPLDPSALSNKAEVLWRRGNHSDAIRTMEQVTKAQPNNATFLFRLGRFLHQSGVYAEARKYFERAKVADPSYIDVRLSLASVLIDQDEIDAARDEINSVQGKGSVEKQAIQSSVEAKYWLAAGDLDKAAKFAEESLSFRKSPTSLGLMAKVEAAKLKAAEQKGLLTVAEMHRRRAKELNTEGLRLDPYNVALQHQFDSL